VTLRRAVPADAPSIARVHRLAMRISLPFLPELHTAEEDLWFVRERLMTSCEIWVADAGGEAVGYIAFKPGWIEHLYIHPEHQGRGLGGGLLDVALADGSERNLWTFQENRRARAFYERRGFTAVEFTDGEGNEEKTPDVRYVRPACNPKDASYVERS